MATAMNRRHFIGRFAGAVGAAFLTAWGRSDPSFARTAVAAKVNIKGATVSYLTPTGFEKAAHEASAEFEAQHGAKVRISVLPTLQLRDKLLAEYVSKTSAYDVVNISPWWLGDFGPFLEPLEKYIKDPDIAISDFDFADFDANLLKAYTTFERRLVGLPSRADHMMLLYRTDLFESPKDKEAFRAKYKSALAPPKTWDEFSKIAEFFTRPNEGLWGTAVMGKRSHQSGAQWINRFFGFGGSYFDDNSIPKINTGAGIKALQYLVNAGKFSLPGYLTYESFESRQAFWDGKAAMIEAWPGTVVVPGQDPKQSKIVGKINGIVMPNGHGCGGGWFYAVSADSKNKIAAYKWLELLSSKKYVRRSYELEGQMPGRKSPYAEPYVTTTLPEGFSHQFALAFATSVPPPNRFPEDSELKTELDRYVSEAVAGLKSPERAMTDAEESWKAILKRAGRIK